VMALLGAKAAVTGAESMWEQGWEGPEAEERGGGGITGTLPRPLCSTLPEMPGKSVLHAAAGRGLIKSTAALISAKVDIDALDSDVR